MKKNLVKKLFIFYILIFLSCYSSVSQTAVSSAAASRAAAVTQTNASSAVTIYLIGFAGTGKYTIAKALSRYGYKVVDNHLINNPIFSLLGPDGARKANERDTEKIARIRDVVLEFIAEDHRSNYILTNQLAEKEYHHYVYDRVLETANKRGSIFIPIVLNISPEERARRISQSTRANQYKITDPAEAYKPTRKLKVTHENLYEIDVTHLSAEKAAERIMEYVQHIKNSR